MTTSVGGINIGIGANVANVLKGFNTVNTQLSRFQKKMSDIRLSAAIKGDPFSETRKYFKTAGTELNDVFKSWSKDIGYVPLNMNKLAEKSRKVTEAVVKDWQKVNKEFGKLRTQGKTIASGKTFDLGLANIAKNPKKLYEKTTSPKFIENFKKLKNSLVKIKPELRSVFKSIEEGMRNLTSGENWEDRQINEEMLKGIKGSSVTIQNAFKHIKRTFTEEEQKIINDYVKFGKKLKVAFEKSAKLEARGMTIAGIKAAPEKVQKEHISTLQKTKVVRAELNAKIAEAIRLNRDASVVLDLYQQKEKAGIKLTEKEINHAQRLTKVNIEALKAQRLRDKMYEAEKIEDRRATKVKKLVEEYDRLAKTMKKGVAPAEKTKDLEAKHNAIVAHGGKLKKEQLAILDKQIKKQRIIEGFKGGFLSPSWMKQRAGWFLQLRGFWGLYRVVTDLYQATKELEKGLAGLHAVTLATDAGMASMKNTVIETSKIIAVDITDIAKGMIKLGQAGLSVSEVNSSIRAVATLAAATMTDMDTASDLITTSMKAWQSDMLSAIEVTDILANTVNNSKVNIKGLSTALQYLTGVAPQVGMSLQDTSAIIGVMANRGIKMSKIGTGFRSLLGELLKPSEKFKKSLYGVGLTLHDVDLESNNVIDIIKKFKAAGFDASIAFKGLDRRAAAAISALISGADGLQSFADGLGAVGTASKMAEVQMGTLISKTTLLKNKMVALTTRMFDDVKPMLKGFIDGLSFTADGLSKASDGVGKFLSIIGALATAIGGLALAKFVGTLLKVAKQAGKFKAIFVALASMFSVWGVVIAGVTTGLLLFIKHLATAKYALDNHRIASVKAKKELYNLEGSYKSFNELSEKYREAMKAGNVEEATRIAQQHEELQQIHMLTSASGEYNKSLDTRIELYKEDIIAKRKVADLEDKLYMRSLIKNIRRKTGRAFKAHGRRAPETEAETLQRLKTLNEAIIELNIKAGELINDGIATTVEDGINKLKDLYGEDVWGIIVRDGEKAIENLEKNMQRLIAKKNLNREIENLYKDVTPAKIVDPLVVESFMEQYKAEPALKEFLDTHKTIYNELNKLIKTDLTKATGYIEKFINFEKDIKPKTYTSMAKGLLEKAGFDLKEDVEHKKAMIASIATLLKELDIKTIFSGMTGPTWKEFDAATAKIKSRIDNIGVQRSDIEKKVATIVEKYSTQRLKFETLESKERGKAITELGNLEKEEIASVIDVYNKKIQKEVESAELVLMNLNETNTFQKQRNSLDVEYLKKLADINKEIAGAKEIGTPEGKLAVLVLKKRLSALKDINDKKNEDLVLSEILGNKELEYNKDILAIKKKRNVLEDTTLDKLKSEAEELRRHLIYVEDKRDTIGEIFLTDRESFEINKELNGIYEDQAMNIHKQRLETDLLYNTFYALKDEAGTFNDLMKSSVSDFAIGMGAGVGDMMFQASSGFQENRQEVVNLKGEMKELKKEKDELTETGILSADEAERLKEINKEMNNLKGDINDLENPIKSLGETFKTFFKDLIDGINKAITQWIAMKIVMGIAGAMGDKGSGYTQYMFGGQSAGFKADGGVLGNITSFKKFSNGGTINNPTLAMIGEGTGDNREIVVPMKNIKQDHVEGYMKDSSDPIVNVINVITEDDLAMQLAKPKIGQVIVNRVYQNSNNQGILSRR